MRVITGTARGVVLKTPDGNATRPTADRVKEAVFSMLQFQIAGACILDLFGGTGQLGIEALSRGAKSATFVDVGEAACRLIRENLKRTNLAENARVVRSDYMLYLKRCKEKFDIVFLDPPYAELFLENSLKTITEIDILQSDAIIVTERPYGKVLSVNVTGFERSKDYKYGNTVITLFRKTQSGEVI